jgi:tetratricopeptide (TPR) repeat protein
MGDKEREQFRKLQHSSNNHRCHLAIAIGERYCRRYPHHAPAWLFFGRALAEAHRYQEGRDALRRGLIRCPANRRASFYAQLGHLEAFAGDFAKAESWYRRAFDAAPTESVERLYLGEILYRQGKLHDAELTLEEVTSRWNDSLAEAWHLLGEVKASQGRHRAALECFRLAAESNADCKKHSRRVREMISVIRVATGPRNG